VSVVVLHAGVPPEQFASAKQPTHVLFAVLHVDVAPVQAVLFVLVHWTHE
jgi:hypothetical protein